MKLIPVFVGLTLLVAACQTDNSNQAKAPEKPPFSPYADVDSVTYSFYPEGTQYVLKNSKTGQSWTIAQDLLKVPVAHEELAPETEPQYGPLVMAFPGGKGKTCLYISAYEIADGGSLALAEGYDVFLMLDLVSNKLTPNVLHLGLTRGRHKTMGYFEAHYTRLYISYPPETEGCRIGLRKEKVYMEWDQDMGTPKSGPYHDIEPLIWYHFDGNKWIHDPKHDRLFPRGKGSGEIPHTTHITSIEMAQDIYRSRPY